MVEVGLIKKSKNKKKHSSKKSRPIHIKTDSDNDIYIGKNSKQNDYLTLKLANKDDYWFHVKNVAGSHVILRCNNFNDEDIYLAAKLAAKYSSLSDEKKVEVDYTQKKNVYKSKGAKPGMVYYNDFKTILIELD